MFLKSDMVFFKEIIPQRDIFVNCLGKQKGKVLNYTSYT